jgi:hypothetical protein
MPIALLLQQTVYTFRWGGRHLEPWIHLVHTEETLIDRSRSAFMIHWFGSGLPLQGFHVRIAIANLQELRQRYLEVKREVVLRASGPNLTEPMFGMAGAVSGMVLTPGVAIFTAFYTGVSIPWWLRILLGLLIVSVAAVGLSPALAAAGFAGYLQVGLGNYPETRALYDFLGELANLLAAARDFIDQLLGPREAVKNPLLSDVLMLADRLAQVLPFGLALIAFVVTWLGPLLLPLAAQARAFLSLVDQLVDAATFIFKDLTDQLIAFFTGAVVALVIALQTLADDVVRPLRAIMAAVRKFFAAVQKSLLDLIHTAPDRITAWKKSLRPRLEEIVNDLPLMRKIDVLKQVGDLLTTEDPTDPPSKPPKVFVPWLAEARTWWEEARKAFALFPSAPDIPSPTDMIDKLELPKKHGIPEKFEEYREKIKQGLPPVSAEVTKYVEHARQPTSIFDEERNLLAADLGAAPSDALKAAHGRELQLRDLIGAVVTRVLPPDLRGLIIPMANMLSPVDDLVDEMTGAKKPANKDAQAAKRETARFPVKELSESAFLRPVMQRLVIRAPGAARDRVEEFRMQLQLALTRRAYPLPAGG